MLDCGRWNDYQSYLSYVRKNSMCKNEQKCRYNYTIDVYIKTQLFTHQNLKTLASGFFFSTDYIATQNKLPLNLYKAIFFIDYIKENLLANNQNHKVVSKFNFRKSMSFPY